MTFRKRLLEERKKRGWTQDDLANRAGLTQACISYLEAGQCDVSLPTARKLCKTLSVPWEALLGKP